MQTTQFSCIFCPAPLDGSEKKQHILQESIGGTLTTQTTTCTGCNDYFARSLDIIVAEKFALLMNVLGPAIKARGPQITMYLKGSRKPITMAPGQIPISEPRVERQSDGKVSVRGKDMKQAEKLFKSTGNVIGPTTKIVYDTMPASGTAITTLTLLHPDELRSAIKVACEYLCHVDPKLRMAIDFREPAAVVRQNQGSEALVPVIMPLHPTRELVAAGFTDVPFSHRIWISCDEANGAHCLIDLFSSVAYRFRLGSFSGKARSFLYQKNILKNAPPDFYAMLDIAMPLPPVPPRPDLDAYLKQESLRLGRLSVEALWYVDTNCRDTIVEIFAQGIRTDKAPGTKVDVTMEELLKLMQIRISRVFTAALKDRQAAAESREIFKRLNEDRIFKGESVDKLSKEFEDCVWRLHSQLYALHKKYVGQPDYGAEHYDAFAESTRKITGGGANLTCCTWS